MKKQRLTEEGERSGMPETGWTTDNRYQPPQTSGHLAQESYHMATATVQPQKRHFKMLCAESNSNFCPPVNGVPTSRAHLSPSVAPYVVTNFADALIDMLRSVCC